MATCNCGSYVDDIVTRCPSCGRKMTKEQDGKIVFSLGTYREERSPRLGEGTSSSISPPSLSDIRLQNGPVKTLQDGKLKELQRGKEINQSLRKIATRNDRSAPIDRLDSFDKPAANQVPIFVDRKFVQLRGVSVPFHKKDRTRIKDAPIPPGQKLIKVLVTSWIEIRTIHSHWCLVFIDPDSNLPVLSYPRQYIQSEPKRDDWHSETGLAKLIFIDEMRGEGWTASRISSGTVVEVCRMQRYEYRMVRDDRLSI